MNIFENIFLNYNTDKVRVGGYHEAYEKSFFEIRNEVKLLFEIGVYQGGSLHGFNDYFPNALIVGIDIDPRIKINDKRIITEIGDATNCSFIEGLLHKYGQPDIVIDDGSHFSKDIKNSFSILYPQTKICYVIEDLATQYPAFLNGYYINDDLSAMTVLNKKIEELLLIKGSCRSINIYHSLAFIFK